MVPTTQYELFVSLKDDKLCQDVLLALTVYLVGLTRKLALFVWLVFLSYVLTKFFLVYLVFI